MTISLDFDNTWTKDPDLWNGFIQSAESLGHKVICITNREVWSGDMVRHSLPSIPILFAGRQFKRSYAEEQGIKVDIWIDDMPGTVEESRYLKDTL